MSIQVVKNYISKSIPKQHRSGPSHVKKTLKQCLLDLESYIDTTIDEFIGNIYYDDETLSNWIYKNDDNSEEYYKINLYAAKQTFKSIIKKIQSRKGGLNYNNIIVFKDLINDFLHDISGFINYYRRKKESDFVFLSGWKNYETSSFETFAMAVGLFNNSLFKKNFIPYKESQGMVAIAIRQSLEIKTKRIFGINKIKKTRKGVRDYSFKKLFKFIEDNTSDIIYDEIEFEVLKNIYTWSCAYIHNGEISYLWQTETALTYLNRYFKSGSYRSGGRTNLTIYGAFKLKNFDVLRNKLNAFIGNDYEIEYFPNNKIEAIILS